MEIYNRISTVRYGFHNFDNKHFNETDILRIVEAEIKNIFYEADKLKHGELKYTLGDVRLIIEDNIHYHDETESNSPEALITKDIISNVLGLLKDVMNGEMYENILNYRNEIQNFFKAKLFFTIMD